MPDLTREEVESLVSHIVARIRAELAFTAVNAPDPRYAQGFHEGYLKAKFQTLGALRHMLGMCPRCGEGRPGGSSLSICPECRKTLANANSPNYLLPKEAENGC